MYSIVTTAALHGIEAIPVTVEADVGNGLPAFEMVGFLASEVKEAKERVRTALKNCGYQLPAKRITISFSPASIRKAGAGYDLAIAVAILTALGELSQENVRDKVFLGELSLSGKVLPVRGILPMTAKMLEEGWTSCIVPVKNQREATLLPRMEVRGVGDLEEVIDWLKGRKTESINIEERRPKKKELPDFSEVNGQKAVKRACEVAVAGRHNFMMIGPPGAGKTMIAKRIPSILPPMSEQERLEVSKIYSVCGMLEDGEGLMEQRPFRNPHHTISKTGMAGGGGRPRPGEISLAHNGVLFLDELTEFSKPSLEILRQPLEEHQIRLVRANGNYRYPADFMLVAAMNPCNCGYYPDMQKCRCSLKEIRGYQNRISQPLLDRIDICVEAKAIAYGELVKTEENESSAQIRKRVMQAHEIQRKRYAACNFRYNSQIPSKDINLYCKLGKKQEKEMQKIYENLELTVRSYHKILKTARTIADLEGCENIEMKHLYEAVCYRSLDKKFWERTYDI